MKNHLRCVNNVTCAMRIVYDVYNTNSLYFCLININVDKCN